MQPDDWIEEAAEAFRRRLEAALEDYRAAGLNPVKVLGPPDDLGARAAGVSWPGLPEAPDRLHDRN